MWFYSYYKIIVIRYYYLRLNSIWTILKSIMIGAKITMWAIIIYWIKIRTNLLIYIY